MRDLVAKLANREERRTEATVQADVRQLLLAAPLDLASDDLQDIVLESPVGDRRRIDIELGTTVIEVKRDLRKGKVKAAAVEQLAGYVSSREEQTSRRYVGILTDGAEWRCYHLVGDWLAEVSAYLTNAKKPDADRLVLWLDGVMATARGVPPTPDEIRRRLGASSSSHALDRASLTELYAAHKNEPSVRMKRRLWARLLTTALGSQFRDDDELFVEHTLLVNFAEVIAHAVLGLSVEAIEPATLLSGARFGERGVHGVVEEDFFDWVVEISGGKQFVRTLAHRLGRFDWHRVDHDILKVLYESVIEAPTRKQLGEYYTPDWLAEAIVESAVDEPLEERVLDPACGSGTFLFHAVRRYLKAGEQAGVPQPDLIRRVTRHVIGLDLHPVAVTLARVTYLLALGQERLADPERPEVQVPVYLGDSLQWYQKRPDLWSAGQLVVQVGDRRDLFSEAMRFPGAILADARVFDELVSKLAHRASDRSPGEPIPGLSALFRRLKIPAEHHDTIQATFETMCQLHDEGRDHIWSYYIRNLARPVWLSRTENRVDVLVGNPPWLAYRHMPKDMQAMFREMSSDRGLWHGAKVATHQDLSGLFVARVMQLYLRHGGTFAFVVPNAVLDRGQFVGFRRGDFADPVEPAQVAFDRPWDLRRLRPHFFPRGAAVVWGHRSEKAGSMDTITESWSGRLPRQVTSWREVRRIVHRDVVETRTVDAAGEGSAYRQRFAQGATVVPRMLFLVNEMAAGPLGVPAGQVPVRSRRSANEKPPWKLLPGMEGVVETDFVRALYLGESVLPYRTVAPALAVVPWDDQLLTGDDDEQIELYPGLAKWWRAAESCWLANRSSDRLTLLERLDYRRGFTSQFPIHEHEHRIVYTKSGMHLAAARVDDPGAVIDHKLYWAAVTSLSEARYVCTVLNSAIVTELVRPLMSYGKDERDIDKHVWKLPIPVYSEDNPQHVELARAGEIAEQEVAALEIDEQKHFSASRRLIRKHLAASETGQRIEQLVSDLLG